MLLPMVALPFKLATTFLLSDPGRESSIFYMLWLLRHFCLEDKWRGDRLRLDCFCLIAHLRNILIYMITKFISALYENPKSQKKAFN